MIKKLLALVVCIMGVATSAAPIFADSFTTLSPAAPVSQGSTTSAISGVTGACYALRTNSSPTLLMTLDCSGNLGVNSLSSTGLTPGNCVQAGANGILTTASAACASGGGGASFYFQYSNNSPYALTTTASYASQGVAYSLPFGFSIGHVYLACTSYNAVEVAAGRSLYTTVLTTGNTFGGGSIGIAITNTTFNLTAPNVLGTITMPTTTYPGPYTVNAVLTLGTPYTVGLGDNLTYSKTASTATLAPTGCQLGVGT